MQTSRQLVPVTAGTTNRRHYAFNLAASLLLAWGAAQCFVAGDGARYDGVLVALGWVLALIGWRTFSHRREPVRNPAEHLLEAAGIVATGAVHFAWRIVIALAGLLAIAGLLGLAERFAF